MDADMRLTHPSLKILRFFQDSAATAEISGSDITKGTGLLSGTVYPVLLRFESLGLLTSRWEDVDPSAVKRPRRRFYRLTGEGARVARTALRELESAPGILLPEGA